jgi:hypothetical protein
MSEETENSTPNEPITPKEEVPTPKPAAKKPMPQKPAGNPFLGKAGSFQNSKGGNPGFKGKSFKGMGVKKGK